MRRVGESFVAQADVERLDRVRHRRRRSAGDTASTSSGSAQSRWHTPLPAAMPASKERDVANRASHVRWSAGALLERDALGESHGRRCAERTRSEDVRGARQGRVDDRRRTQTSGTRLEVRERNRRRHRGRPARRSLSWADSRCSSRSSARATRSRASDPSRVSAGHADQHEHARAGRAARASSESATTGRPRVHCTGRLTASTVAAAGARNQDRRLVSCARASARGGASRAAPAASRSARSTRARARRPTPGGASPRTGRSRR